MPGRYYAQKIALKSKKTTKKHIRLNFMRKNEERQAETGAKCSYKKHLSNELFFGCSKVAESQEGTRVYFG